MTTNGQSMRRLFVEGAGSLGAKARERRWRRFLECFPNLAELSVLDLGGTADYWLDREERPRNLHLVNLAGPSRDLPGWMRVDVADACSPPDGLLDDAYDLVYSNSVIEHVGGHRRREEFAAVAGRHAPSYWIQTPYRYFPIEPHWVAPMMQFLPLRARATFGRVWPLSYSGPDDLQHAIATQLDVELLDITQMRHYFPDARIEYERILGVVKSLIAVR